MAREPKFWLEVWDNLATPDGYYVFGTDAERAGYMSLLNEEYGYPDNIGGNLIYKFLYRTLSASDVKREKPRKNGGSNIRDIIEDLKARVVEIRADRLKAQMEAWDLEEDEIDEEELI